MTILFLMIKKGPMIMWWKTLVILVLDLRWNSVGLLGGRAILEMLKTNKTICRLELAGNNIPGDILKSIGKNCLNISYKMFYLFMYITQILSLLETYIPSCFSYLKRSETDHEFPTMIYMYMNCIHRIWSDTVFFVFKHSFT